MFNKESKVFVVGTSGSGKSTFARTLSQKIGVVDIELDQLFWKANWTESEPEEFRAKISKAISDNKGWVMHGNYNKVRDLTWGNTETLIWLDYSKTVVMYRVIKRSLKRIFTQEELWAGNKESIKKTFFSKQSIILWSWQTYATRKTQYLKFMQDPDFKHIKVIRFTNPSEAEIFLSSVA
ncbi:MAG: adenylate kinase [Pseudobdellovibrio sp.]